MNRIPFENNHFYHIYNRGVDKRSTFKNRGDMLRFIELLSAFNTNRSAPGGIRFTRRNQGSTLTNESLVVIHGFCLLENHFHILLEQKTEGGVSKFMQKVSTGYTMYFNKKYERSGALFQGRFKSKHVTSDGYLLRCLSYVVLNFKVHNNKKSGDHLYCSSHAENEVHSFISKKIIKQNFKSDKDFLLFANKQITDTKQLRSRLNLDL